MKSSDVNVECLWAQVQRKGSGAEAFPRQLWQHLRPIETCETTLEGTVAVVLQSTLAKRNFDGTPNAD